MNTNTKRELILNQIARDSVGPIPIFQSGGTIKDTTPAFSGSATPGEVVTLIDGEGNSLGSVVTNANGQWSLEISHELSNGSHQIIATTSTQSTPPFNVTVNVGGTAPLKINPFVFDQEGSVFGDANDDGAPLVEKRPVLSGSGEPGELVTLYDQNNNPIGQGIADKWGQWKIQVDQDLQEGLNTITAKTASSVGQPLVLNLQSEAFKLAFDEYASDNEGLPSQFKSGEATNDARPEFSGKAVPDELVTLKDETGRVLGSVRADSEGNWKIEITTSLEEGTHAITAHTANSVSDTFNVIIDFSLVAPLRVDSSVYDDDGKAWDSQQTLSDLRPTLRGTGEPGEIVTLYNTKNQALGSTTIDAKGQWSIEVTRDLPNGQNILTAKTETSTVSSDVINIESADYTLTMASFVLDDVGGYDLIRAGGITNDDRPTASGSAAPGVLVTIYDETGRPVGSVVAGPSGTWRVELTESLSNGAHELTAKTALQQAEGFTFTVDTGAKTSVHLNPWVFDDNGNIYGANDETDRIADTRPTFSGQGEPGELVTLYDQQDRPLGSVTVGQSGYWETEITQPLDSDANSITAKTATSVSESIVINVESASYDITALLQDSGDVLFAASEQEDSVHQGMALNVSAEDLRVTTESGVFTQSVTVAPEEEDTAALYLHG